MAVTEEPNYVDEKPSLASPRPPARARIPNPTWVLVLLGVLAAIALAVVALRPDADPVVANHRLIIENGSIAAVDHAAEVERGGVSEAAGPATTGSSSRTAASWLSITRPRSSVAASRGAARPATTGSSSRTAASWLSITRPR